MDQRERPMSNWVDNSMVGRVRYTENKGYAALIIENVHESDSGQYRCRKDFKYSPTHNNFIMLDIISKYNIRYIKLQKAVAFVHTITNLKLNNLNFKN